MQCTQQGQIQQKKACFSTGYSNSQVINNQKQIKPVHLLQIKHVHTPTIQKNEFASRLYAEDGFVSSKSKKLKTNIITIDYELKPQVEDYLAHKIDQMFGKYEEHIDFVTAKFSSSKNQSKNQDRVKDSEERMQLKLQTKNQGVLIADDAEEVIQKSIDSACGKIVRQLEKAKGKNISQSRKQSKDSVKNDVQDAYIDASSGGEQTEVSKRMAKSGVPMEAVQESQPRNAPARGGS